MTEAAELVEKTGVLVQRRKVSVFMKMISPAPQPFSRRDLQSRHPRGHSQLIGAELAPCIFQLVAWQVQDGTLIPAHRIRDARLFFVALQSSFGFSLRFFQLESENCAYLGSYFQNLNPRDAHW